MRDARNVHKGMRIMTRAHIAHSPVQDRGGKASQQKAIDHLDGFDDMDCSANCIRGTSISKFSGWASGNFFGPRVPPHSKSHYNECYLLNAAPLEATPLETTLQQVLLAHSHPTRSHLTRIAAVLRVSPFFQLSSKPINSESNILRAWICSGPH